jgi:hypothetical protein
MEYRHQQIVAVMELAGYYSVDNYRLRDGLRAAFGSEG